MSGLLGKVVWSLERQQQENVEQFLCKHKGDVILWQFSCDCTPLKLRMTRDAQLA